MQALMDPNGVQWRPKPPAGTTTVGRPGDSRVGALGSLAPNDCDLPASGGVGG